MNRSWEETVVGYALASCNLEALEAFAPGFFLRPAPPARGGFQVIEVGASQPSECAVPEDEPVPSDELYYDSDGYPPEEVYFDENGRESDWW